MDTSRELDSKGSISHLTDGPVISPAKAWNSYPLALVDGVLSKKKGCLIMHEHVVFWPHGTQWDREKQAVVFGDGSEALVGQVFTGGGGSYDATVDFESLLDSRTAAAKIARCVRVTGASQVLVAAP